MSAAEKTGKTTNWRRRELIVGEVLDTATELFAVKGYEATSLQDIADAVGVSRPALYHYLSSKEDLLVMLVEGVSQSLAEVLGELRERPDLTPSEKISMVTYQLVRQRVQHPGRFRILDRSRPSCPSPPALITPSQAARPARGGDDHRGRCPRRPVRPDGLAHHGTERDRNV